MKEVMVLCITLLLHHRATPRIANITLSPSPSLISVPSVPLWSIKIPSLFRQIMGMRTFDRQRAGIARLR
jgi:hypothetical protein